MKIVLIGASGLLGKKLLEIRPREYEVIPTFSKHTRTFLQLDITNSQRVEKVLTTLKPDIIIHSASIGDVDYCEKHQKQAWHVNVEGTKHIINTAKKLNSKIIFFSSNAVFSGDKPPYDENAYVKPLNFYGRTKVEGEKLLSTYKANSLIFRLTTMFGWNNEDERKNPATWLIERLNRKQKTPVVTDVFNNHLWVGQAAKAVWKAIKKQTYGELFHIGGKDCMSRFDFSRKVAEVFDLDDTLLVPVTSDFFKNITPRPPHTEFSVAKMKHLLGIQPLDIITGLQKMKQDHL